jgi:hypothetical protein
MTAPRTPGGPRGHRQASPAPAPDWQAGDIDRSEMNEPDDLYFPDDVWPAGRPEYVIVIAQRRTAGPGHLPSLDDILRNGRVRAREPEPEPDLEAEP